MHYGECDLHLLLIYSKALGVCAVCSLTLMNHFLCRSVTPVLACWDIVPQWEEEEVRQEEEGWTGQATVSEA